MEKKHCDVTYSRAGLSVLQNQRYCVFNTFFSRAAFTVLDLNILIHVFISSRLQSSNSLYVGVCQSSVSRLQLVQDAAGRLLTGTR